MLPTQSGSGLRPPPPPQLISYRFSWRCCQEPRLDTTNFTDKTNFSGSGENLHLIERFTRTGPDSLTYEFTVDDPSSFVRPWTVQIPMSKTEGPVLEYACTEGNYAMAGMLEGARREEKREKTE